jgi:hypothetical protein
VHVGEAQALVDALPSTDRVNPDNQYGGVSGAADENLRPIIRWPGEGAPFNRTRCAQFISLLLRHSYGWSDADFARWFGSLSPLARDYQEHFASSSAGSPFIRVERVADLAAGDVVAVTYADDLDDSGHVVMIAGAPERTTGGPVSQENAGLQQWAVPIVDSTKSPHGRADSRAATGQQGVGRGHMRFYADPVTGGLAGYAWSLETRSTYHAASSQPIAAGRLRPPADEHLDATDGAVSIDRMLGPAVDALRPTVDVAPPELEPSSPRLRIRALTLGRRSARLKARCRTDAGRCVIRIGLKTRTLRGRRWASVQRVVRLRANRWTTLRLRVSERQRRTIVAHRGRVLISATVTAPLRTRVTLQRRARLTRTTPVHR